MIRGLKNYLTKFSPIIVLEFLSEKLGNKAHKKTEEVLTSLNYKPYCINNNGAVESLPNTLNYFSDNNIDSDNLVFIKT